MKKMYHATKYSNLYSIMNKGLRPGIDGVVYLAESKEDALKFICIRVLNEPILVLEVEVDEANIQETFDHSYHFFKARAWGCSKTIPFTACTGAWKYS